MSDNIEKVNTQGKLTDSLLGPLNGKSFETRQEVRTCFTAACNELRGLIPPGTYPGDIMNEAIAHNWLAIVDGRYRISFPETVEGGVAPEEFGTYEGPY